MKKLTFLILVAFLWCGRAQALTRMGPPTATCEQGQFLIAPEFSYSENDVERDGGRDTTVEITTLLARVAYGLQDDWELFVRGGTGGGSSWIPITLGAGVKWTFLPDSELPWGLLLQTHWLPGTSFASEFDLYEIQIAAGPTYCFDRLCLYGGPFLHFLRGEEDSSVFGTHLDLEEESVLGAYAGVRTELTDSIGLDVEFQATPDAYCVALGLPWRF
jgi:opacity protein-like surface antigen